ncbi:SAF domain-containing protein [Metabacillus sp. B2-18]|uniref:SAF domain-containing protein n=1 Tax=Metabacillus sp. B2-18 TaxID=2897333 RepID=UPI001E56D0F7|nr:SAF domain-containing protein [Metabacillus sp. B2-18]UGB33752.1 SAF domain-containing protein [Metabacillus sp. B2-18]
MKKRINKNLFLGIFFFILFIAAIVVSETGVLGKINTVTVVMANTKIEKDTILSEENVILAEYPRELITDDMYRHISDVIGKTAVQTIQPSAFIDRDYLDQSLLKPTKDHEFFPIPNNWLVKLQGTIRRYDLINISAVYVGTGQDTGAVLQQNVKNEYVLENVPVAYVKGSRNQEVSGLTSQNDRLNGNQNAAQIELSLTLEDFKVLEKLTKEGYQFVLSY